MNATPATTNTSLGSMNAQNHCLAREGFQRRRRLGSGR